MKTEIKVNDEVICNGLNGTVEALLIDGKGETIARLAPTRSFAGLDKIDREVAADELTITENQALANRFGTTAARVRSEEIAFLQAEGYFETSSKIIECRTFEYWLKLALAKDPYRISEPWQKSDLDYGL